MPAEHTYDYALIRVVPRVDRGAWQQLDSSGDLESIQGHLDAIVRICRGGPSAGPVGELPQRGRFHWLVSPRSTVIQMSAVHTGRTADPAGSLARLVETMVKTR